MSSTGKDSLLGNKIAAGLLTAGLIFWAANRIASIVVSDESPKTPAIAITGLQTAAAPVAAAAPAVSIDTLFATADVAKGQALVNQQCSACHTLAKGGASGVGPNLYGILGAKAFSPAGFAYPPLSPARPAALDPDSLSAWLQNPATFAPGTGMSFAGIKNDQSRANVIAYLNSNSDAPAKLPDNSELIAAAEAALDAAGAAIRPHFRAGVVPDDKSDESPVTVVLGPQAVPFDETHDGIVRCRAQARQQSFS